MKVIFFRNLENLAGKELCRLVEPLIPNESKEIFEKIEDLRARLTRPVYGDTIAVLLAADQKDLSDILSLHHLFRSIRLILVLPDRSQSTLSKGHSIYPRFLTYVDDDISRIAAVLDKMRGQFVIQQKERG